MLSSSDKEPITPPLTPMSSKLPRISTSTNTLKSSSSTSVSPKSSTTSETAHKNYFSQSSHSTSKASLASEPTRTQSFPVSTSIRENVQVMVRCRPRSAKESESDETPCWILSPENGCIESTAVNSLPSSAPRAFYYDNVFMGVDNSEVYQVGVRDLVRSSMKGYNGTVFAYGQTASGKTYTMTGTEKEPGIIPRAVNEVFAYIEEDTSGRRYLLRVSYMEIYNETIKDLLNIRNTKAEVVEDDKRGVYVRNLKEAVVKTPEEIKRYIKEGENNRHISSTDFNEHSSRSHTMLQIIIESRSHGDSGVRVSQLNLIDLAGSERSTSNVERRKEGAYINKSLLHLGNVISKLTSEKRETHIPFRDSKLTRILQTSLSGNARIAIICTVNPMSGSRNESLNTLRFASKAKLIKTAAKMTRVTQDSELQAYLVTIAQLQTKMQEKTDLESEAKERLKSLLSLILTSSKIHDKSLTEDENLPALPENSGDNLLNEDIRDVVVKCHKSFVEHTQKVEALKDVVNVMTAAYKKKEEAVAIRDAQIEKLKQELASAKAAAAKAKSSASPKLSASPQRTSHSPMKPSNSSKEKLTEEPVKVISMEDLAPAIIAAAQHVADAIMSGLDQQKIEPLKANVLKSVEAPFKEAISCALSGQKVVISQDSNALTEAISLSANQQPCTCADDTNTDEAVIQPDVVEPPAAMRSSFVSINEAVSFIQPLEGSRQILSTIEAVNEFDDTIEAVIEFDDNDDADLPGLTGETTLYESLEFTPTPNDIPIRFLLEDSVGSEAALTDPTDFQQEIETHSAPLLSPPFSPVDISTTDSVPYIPYSSCIIQPSFLSVVSHTLICISALYMLAFL